MTKPQLFGKRASWTLPSFLKVRHCFILLTYFCFLVIRNRVRADIRFDQEQKVQEVRKGHDDASPSLLHPCRPDRNFPVFTRPPQASVGAVPISLA